jgi:hypothetical protein
VVGILDARACGHAARIREGAGEVGAGRGRRYRVARACISREEENGTGETDWLAGPTWERRRAARAERLDGSAVRGGRCRDQAKRWASDEC